MSFVPCERLMGTSLGIYLRHKRLVYLPYGTPSRSTKEVAPKQPHLSPVRRPVP